MNLAKLNDTTPNSNPIDTIDDFSTHCNKEKFIKFLSPRGLGETFDFENLLKHFSVTKMENANGVMIYFDAPGTTSELAKIEIANGTIQFFEGTGMMMGGFSVDTKRALGNLLNMLKEGGLKLSEEHNTIVDYYLQKERSDELRKQYEGQINAIILSLKTQLLNGLHDDEDYEFMGSQIIEWLKIVKIFQEANVEIDPNFFEIDLMREFTDLYFKHVHLSKLSEIISYLEEYKKQ